MKISVGNPVHTRKQALESFSLYAQCARVCVECAFLYSMEIHNNVQMLWNHPNTKFVFLETTSSLIESCIHFIHE